MELEAKNGDGCKDIEMLMTVVNGTVNLLRSDTSVKNAYLISSGNKSCAVLLDLDESELKPGDIQITCGEEQDCCFLYYNGIYDLRLRKKGDLCGQ